MLPQFSPMFTNSTPMATHAQGGFMTGYPTGWDPASGLGMPPRVLDSIYYGASKLVSFTAIESVSKCVGSTADSASRQHVGSIASGSKCISTAINGSSQRVGCWVDTSSAKLGDADTTQVSYRGPLFHIPS